MMALLAAAELGVGVTAALLVATFIGYPIWLALLAAVRPRPYPSGPDAIGDDELPTVAIVLAGHNEAARLPGKLDSLRALDYPPDRLRFYVADDASNDDTPAVLADLERAEPRLSTHRSDVNVGKPANLNRLVEMAGDWPDVLVFNDARQPLDPAALRCLVAPLLDPDVGGATGDLTMPPAADGSVPGMGAYWRYETFLRDREARTGSVVGATGALYCVRRRLFTPFEPNLVLDDMLGPLRVTLGGARFVFAHGARAFDVYSDDLGHEYRRKVRTLAGIYQAMAFEPRLTRPGSAVFARFFWHKRGRLLLPYLLALNAASALVATGLAAAESPLRAAVPAAIVLGHLGMWAGYGLSRATGKLRLFQTVGTLVRAAFDARRQWSRGGVTAAWKKP
jgi:poly-beta-1,6-N-acetyl-D-glucosamine synthase